MNNKKWNNGTILSKYVVIFLIIVMAIALTGCGKSISGSYVSKTDKSRKITLKKSSNVGIFDGTVSFKDGDKTVSGYYSVSDGVWGKTIMVASTDGNEVELGFFKC